MLQQHLGHRELSLPPRSDLSPVASRCSIHFFPLWLDLSHKLSKQTVHSKSLIHYKWFAILMTWGDFKNIPIFPQELAHIQFQRTRAYLAPLCFSATGKSEKIRAAKYAYSSPPVAEPMVATFPINGTWDPRHPAVDTQLMGPNKQSLWKLFLHENQLSTTTNCWYTYRQLVSSGKKWHGEFPMQTAHHWTSL